MAKRSVAPYRSTNLDYSVVFAGFSAEALRDRINNAAVEVVITADEGMRGGRAIPLKKVVDEAVAQCPSVKKARVLFIGYSLACPLALCLHEVD